MKGFFDYLRGFMGWWNTPAVPPVAGFSGTPLSGNIPLAVQFTDLSTNTPTSWSWVATGQNTATVYTSSEQNPILTFAVADTYDVQLTASNSAGSDDTTKTGYVTALPVFPWTLTWTWEDPSPVSLTWEEPPPVSMTWEEPSPVLWTWEGD